MKTLVENIAAQYEAFASNAALQAEKNNKAAGTRARKAALELTSFLRSSARFQLRRLRNNF